MSISTGKVLKYALLPGIVPRMRDFAASGLSHIAVFMACVYSMVRLLPPQHPYLNPANAGRFGMRHVMGEARKNLVFSRDNIDQIVIFYTLQLGVLILFLQVFMLILSFSVSGAFAAGFGPYIGQFFVRANVDYDIAFIFLDSVFGFNNPPIYNSCVAQGISCDPRDPAAAPLPFATPFHTALHTIFNFYNLGILGIGLLVFLYLVVTIVGETAQTGTPFGRRFNHAWAVPRLLLALILLMPMTWGMNGAQLVVLRVAKWGSNMASNAWDQFNLNLAGSTILGQSSALVVNPNPPEFDNLAKAIFLAQTCQVAQEIMYGTVRQVLAYQVDKKNIGLLPVLAPATFTQALANAQNRDIYIVFGEIRQEYFNGKYAMGVRPLCGEVAIRITALGAIPGAYAMQDAYYNLLLTMWNDTGMRARARTIAERIMPVTTRVPTANPLPDAAFLQSTKTWLQGQLAAAVTNARTAQIADPAWTAAIGNRGWGGAGLWYNRIADLNGRFITSVNNLPTPAVYPEIMEFVHAQRLSKNSSVSGPESYNPSLSDNGRIEYREPGEEKEAIALYIANKLWNIEDNTDVTGSPAFDLMSKIFGLDGLFNMTKNTNIHPLAQLTGVGASLMQAAVRNVGLGVGGGIIGLIFDKNNDAGAALKGLAGAMVGIAKAALMIGFVLYYIVPLLPFIYFFFAVSGWVKGLFEAMVGLPLWALAHVRIDGEGLPGHTAMGGYYLIFEIFLRPILIIFGLLSSMTIFAAMVSVLHMVWSEVVTNVAGTDATPTGVSPGSTGAIEYVRDTAGAFFYTIMYTIVVYMMGMASFKLIDAIPNKIMRWMGASVSSFGERLGDPGGTLVDYGFKGTQLALGGQGLMALFGRWAPGGGDD